MTYRPMWLGVLLYVNYLTIVCIEMLHKSLLYKITYLHTYLLTTTLQPLNNTVHYNTVLYITRFKDGSQKCIDYIEK